MQILLTMSLEFRMRKFSSHNRRFQARLDGCFTRKKFLTATKYLRSQQKTLEDFRVCCHEAFVHDEMQNLQTETLIVIFDFNFSH